MFEARHQEFLRDLIDRALASTGKSRTELAADLGISADALGAYASGRITRSQSALLRLQELTGMVSLSRSSETAQLLQEIRELRDALAQAGVAQPKGFSISERTMSLLRQALAALAEDSPQRGLGVSNGDH